MAQMAIRGNTQILAGTISLDRLNADLRALVESGIDWKQSVRAATTANITLSGTQTIDGVALSVGNRVLVKNQTAAADNGIYVVASGVWARSEDANSATEITQGMTVFVEAGTVNAHTSWVVTGVSFGDYITFTQSGGTGSVTAGNGLTLTGNTLAVGAGDGIAVTADHVHVKLSDTRGNLEFAADTGVKVIDNPHFVSLALGESSIVILAEAGGSLRVEGGIELVQTGAIQPIKWTNTEGDSWCWIKPTAGFQDNTEWLLPTLAGTLLVRGSYIAEEVPSGAINGSNTAFTLANTPVAGSVVLYQNGLRLRSGSGNDYTISGATITMLTAPTTGDVLLATYLRE